MRKIVMCGASSLVDIENFGDQLLKDLYGKWVVDSLPGVELVYLECNGFLRKKPAWNKAFDSSDALVFNGGGYFGEKPFLKDNKVKAWLKKIAWGARNNNLYGAAFRMAKEKGIPVLVSGVEVGPISEPFFKKCVGGVLDYSSYVAVRNPVSYENSKKLAKKNSNINLYVDSAMSINTEMLPDLYSDFHQHVNAKNEKEFMLGVHVHEIASDDHLSGFIKIIEMLRENVSSEKLIKVVFIHDQKKHGRHPARSVDAQVKLQEYFKGMEVLEYSTPSYLLANLVNFDLIVTTKLHLGIVSRALSIPVISCPSHTIKTKRFYAFIGESEMCESVDYFCRNGLPEEIKSYVKSDGGSMPVKDDVKKSAELSKNMFSESLRLI